MKLASKPDPSRREHADRLRREHAAAPALRVAFPDVQQLRLELTFDVTDSSAPVPQSHLLYAAARAFFQYPCPCANCDGGFDLTAAVKAALANKSGRSRGELECPGQRPERHGSRRLCKLRLRYSVAATYQSGDRAITCGRP